MLSSCIGVQAAILLQNRSFGNHSPQSARPPSLCLKPSFQSAHSLHLLVPSPRAWQVCILNRRHDEPVLICWKNMKSARGMQVKYESLVTESHTLAVPPLGTPLFGFPHAPARGRGGGARALSRCDRPGRWLLRQFIHTYLKRTDRSVQIRPTKLSRPF